MWPLFCSLALLSDAIFDRSAAAAAVMLSAFFAVENSTALHTCLGKLEALMREAGQIKS